MKKTTVLYFLLLIGLCAFRDDKLQYKTTDFNLKGKVKTVLTISEWSAKSGNGTQHNFKVFNANGKLVSDSTTLIKNSGYATRIYYYPNDTVVACVIYNFDTSRRGPIVGPSGNKIVPVQYDYPGVFGPYKIIYTYDRVGKLIIVEDTETVKGYRGSRRDKYFYYSDSILQKTYEPANKLRQIVIYKLNKKGQETEITVFDRNKTVTEIVDFKYDEQGNCIWKNDNNLTSGGKDTNEIIYNAHGDMTYERHTMTDPRYYQEISRNSYEYDSTGNWVKQYFSLNDWLWKTVTRKIEYY